MAKAFADDKEVKNVFATTRSNSKELEEVQKKHPERLHILKLDVTSLESVNSALESVSEKVEFLDLLINNAGIALERDPVTKVNPKHVIETFMTNTVGVLQVTNALIPLLKKSPEKAVVVNMSSIGGSISSNKGGLTSYKMSKAALNQLTKGYSVECGDFGTWIVIHPGWVATEMGSKLGSAPLTPEKSVEKMLKVIQSITENENGKFVDNEGKEIPW